MRGKAYQQELLLRMIEPLKSRYSEGGANLWLGAFEAGYGGKVAGLEGFSRVLWGLASYWAGGGSDKSLAEQYRKGLAAGTDPESREYWGSLRHKDQRMVEMAAIAYGILIVPETLWEPLTEREKKNLAAWLSQINHYRQAENNWQFFKVMVNLALKSVGMEWSPGEVRDAMEQYESYYLGNGWYSDGKRPQKDYYVSFGIHFYCLLYARFMGEEDPETAGKYKERAEEFARTFVYWFDGEGRALPFGRSLTYRFAQAAFFSACALAGVECLPWGVMRGIVERNLAYWTRQPIFDNAGILTVGYAYPNLLMSEAYNSPGSPYWAFKSFAALALPDSHPFWQAEPQPLPELEPVRAVPECDMLLCHEQNQVTALTAGQYPVMEHPNAAEKYAKFAYSSAFGFCVSRSFHSLEQAGTDSMLVFYAHGMYYVRRACLEHRIAEREVYSKWSPVEGITVETWLTPAEGGHRRRHRIESSLDCLAYDCGFSYPNRVEEGTAGAGDGYAEAADGNGFSRVESHGGRGTVITALPNLNLVFPNVRIPAVERKIRPGVTEIETLVTARFTEKTIVTGGNCYEVRG